MIVMSTVEQASVSVQKPLLDLNIIPRKFPEDNCGNKMFEIQKQLPNPQKSRTLYSVSTLQRGRGRDTSVVEHGENCQGLYVDSDSTQKQFFLSRVLQRTENKNFYSVSRD